MNASIRTHGRRLLAVSAAVAIGACTDSELRCIADSCRPAQATTADDLVVARGTVCTSDPQNASYPYKVVVVVDTSGSNRDSDPQGGRGRAVSELFARFKDNPQVLFAVVTFSATPTAIQKSFTRDPALLAQAAMGANAINSQTNYLDTLALVQEIITTDIQAAPAAERLFTQYDIQWLSDGNPEVPPPVPATGLPATDRNLIQHCAQTRPLVAEAVQALSALPQKLGFFSLKFNTIFLTGAVTSPCSVLTDINRAQYGTGPDFLQDMARLGNGSYQAVNADMLHFDIDINSLSRPFESHGFFLVNYSRVVRGSLGLADSDQDGVPDTEEDAAGSNPLARVSGPTACSDAAVARTRENPDLCGRLCPAGGSADAQGPLADSDHDTLKDCEEAVVGASPILADTDSDGVGDEVEVRFGTNPLDRGTITLDSDSDSIKDREEVYAGTDPLTPQHDSTLAYRYLPLTRVDAPKPGTTCFTFEVDNVHLAETRATPSSAAGDNLLCLLLMQQPSDDPKAQPTISRACKTANYLAAGPQGAGGKVPADGILTFTAEDFALVVCGGGPCPTQVAPVARLVEVP